MARRVLAWECRYCGQIKKTENICMRHEKTCLKNNDAHNCILCERSYYSSLDDDKLVGTRLMCQEGKKCSQATSADCKYFKRKNDGN